MKKKKDEITIRSSAAEYLTYVASVGEQQDSIEMRYEDENIWLTQKMMATLYGVGLPTINEHIKKIYADSELEESATIRHTQDDPPDDGDKPQECYKNQSDSTEYKHQDA